MLGNVWLTVVLWCVRGIVEGGVIWWTISCRLWGCACSVQLVQKRIGSSVLSPFLLELFHIHLVPHGIVLLEVLTTVAFSAARSLLCIINLGAFPFRYDPITVALTSADSPA